MRLKGARRMVCLLLAMCLMYGAAPVQVRAQGSDPVVNMDSGLTTNLPTWTTDQETTVAPGLTTDLPTWTTDQEVFGDWNANVFYIDSVNGKDTNDGHSPRTPWKSLEKVNAHTFAPGQTILLRAGGVWQGQLWPKGSGAEGRPICIGMYGQGNKPLINGAGVSDTVYLENQEYWEIADLEVTNTAATEAVREGIRVYSDIKDRFLHHIEIRNCYVHDVTGTMKRKDTGGIFVTGNYDGVTIKGNTVRNVYRSGILIRCKRNVWVTGNMVDGIGGDGIQIGGGSMSPLVEYNVAKDCYDRFTNGEYNVAIWPYDTNDALFQYNEAYLTRNTLDGQGFDCDYLCNGTTFQYNYSHDNEGGFMLICSLPNEPDYLSYNRNSVIRYNISQNDRYRIFQIHSKGTQGTQIYNNTVYIGSHLRPLIYDFDLFRPPGTVYSYNNIFYNMGGGTYNYGLQGYHVFENNLFYGNHHFTEPYDPYKVTGDPMFVAPGAAGVGWGTAAVYQINPGSAAINAGKYIEDNGGKDYFGNPLYNGAPDIGAHEYWGQTYAPQRVEYTGEKIQHTDSRIRYTGAWNSSRDDHWSDQKDATIELSFYGNQVKVNGPADPAHGIMAVSIDGGEEVRVDTYSPQRESKTLYCSPMLELGDHTVVIRVTGEKNPAARGRHVDIHNLEIVPDYKVVQSYDAGARKGLIDYYGEWYYGDNDSWSTREGDSYQMTFDGTAIRLIGVKDVNFATIAVSVDGGREQYIPTASSRREGGVLLYEKTGLSPGEHTIRVRLISSGSHTLARLEYLPLIGGARYNGWLETGA